MLESQDLDQAETVNCAVVPPGLESIQPEATPAPEPRRVGKPLVAGVVAILGSLVRLVPHPWNLSPSYAVEIFVGARMRAWQAFALAL